MNTHESGNRAVAVRINPRLEYGATHRAEIKEELRALMACLGADVNRPLAGVVRPGDAVVIKPNLVLDRVSDPRSALTAGQVVEAVTDLVLEALDGNGQVIIADVPLQSADFEAVIELTGLDPVIARYEREGAPVRILDLRKERLRIVNGMYRGVQPLRGDPLGYTVVNLGEASELEALHSDRERFAVGDYDQESTKRYHMSSNRNEYLIPKTILAADVLINLPKIKTHKKAGITCALKNLVGICGHKSYLPHYRVGMPEDHGDEFAVNHSIKELQRDTIDRLKSSNALVYKTARTVGRFILGLAMAREPEDLRKVMAGSWYGNDTLWRTILDLNKIARYADSAGQLHATPQRRYLCIADGIYSGEGDGPLRPSTRHDGILIAGANPVLVDLVVCLLMGIAPEAIRQVHHAFAVTRYPLVDISFEEAMNRLPELVTSGVWPLPDLHYALPPAWEGHVARLAPGPPRGGTVHGGGAA